MISTLQHKSRILSLELLPTLTAISIPHRCHIPSLSHLFPTMSSFCWKIFSHSPQDIKSPFPTSLSWTSIIWNWPFHSSHSTTQNEISIPAKPVSSSSSDTVGILVSSRLFSIWQSAIPYLKHQWVPKVPANLLHSNLQPTLVPGKVRILTCHWIVNFYHVCLRSFCFFKNLAQYREDMSPRLNFIQLKDNELNYLSFISTPIFVGAKYFLIAT